MQVDLDLNETQVLLYALRMYRAHIKEQAEDMIKLDQDRKARQARQQSRKPQPGCMCCLDFEETSEEEKLAKKRQTEDKFCMGLKDKLKMHQMQFPCEEQPKDRKYQWDDENATVTEETNIKKLLKGHLKDMEMSSREDICWLLWKIKCCVEETQRRKERKSCGWGSSRSYIFMGSYDVWESADDGPRYMKIMIDRLNEARDLGVIVNESGEKEWKHSENWYLTEAGEEYYQKNKTWKD